MPTSAYSVDGSIYDIAISSTRSIGGNHVSIGGNHVWIRNTRDVIDYLPDRLAPSESMSRIPIHRAEIAIWRSGDLVLGNQLAGALLREDLRQRGSLIVGVFPNGVTAD